MERWKGYKEAIVWKKVKENDFIDSFYIKLEQDDELPEYQPGQFIAVRVPIGEGKLSKARQYTLSTISNGEYYKISVKKEDNGEVSTLLCDKVGQGDKLMISAPAGSFVLNNGTNPVVFIGGGIGIAPMITMAMEVAGQVRDAHLIYCLPNSDLMAFRKEIDELDQANERLKTTIAFSRPKAEDVFEKDYTKAGRLSKEWLEYNIDRFSDCYLCGPIDFMRTIYHGLIDIGVETERIHYELFRNDQDITK